MTPPTGTSSGRSTAVARSSPRLGRNAGNGGRPGAVRVGNGPHLDVVAEVVGQPGEHMVPRPSSPNVLLHRPVRVVRLAGSGLDVADIVGGDVRHLRGRLPDHGQRLVARVDCLDRRRGGRIRLGRGRPGQNEAGDQCRKRQRLPQPRHGRESEHLAISPTFTRSRALSTSWGWTAPRRPVRFRAFVGGVDSSRETHEWRNEPPSRQPSGTQATNRHLRPCRQRACLSVAASGSERQARKTKPYKKKKKKEKNDFSAAASASSRPVVSRTVTGCSV